MKKSWESGKLGNFIGSRQRRFFNGLRFKVKFFVFFFFLLSFVVSAAGLVPVVSGGWLFAGEGFVGGVNGAEIVVGFNGFFLLRFLVK